MAVNDRWEPYRVILDLEGLEDGILDRIDDLETTFEQIEMAGGMAHGQLQKCLTKNPGKRIVQARNNRHASNKRNFGWESLGKALKGTGLALVLVVDDERFKDTKEQLVRRKRPRQNSHAKPLSKQALNQMIAGAFATHGRKGGLLRSAQLSPAMRRKIAKAAARIRWQKRSQKSAGSPAVLSSTSCLP